LSNQNYVDLQSLVNITVVNERERVRENFIRHSIETKKIIQYKSSQSWQVARKGITPIELATLKKK